MSLYYLYTFPHFSLYVNMLSSLTVFITAKAHSGVEVLGYRLVSLSLSPLPMEFISILSHTTPHTTYQHQRQTQEGGKKGDKLTERFNVTIVAAAAEMSRQTDVKRQHQRHEGNSSVSRPWEKKEMIDGYQ